MDTTRTDTIIRTVTTTGRTMGTGITGPTTGTAGIGTITAIIGTTTTKLSVLKLKDSDRAGSEVISSQRSFYWV